MRHRVVVVGPSVIEVVGTAGGWIFDRVNSGWDVVVMVGDHPDTRPLQILGARVLDLDSALANQSGPHPEALAVISDLYQADDRVREGILRILADGTMDVTVWGGSCPSELHDRFGEEHYRLSAAARVFKAQALAAAGIDSGPVEPTEPFRTAGLSPAGGRALESVS